MLSKGVGGASRFDSDSTSVVSPTMVYTPPAFVTRHEHAQSTFVFKYLFDINSSGNVIVTSAMVPS